MYLFLAFFDLFSFFLATEEAIRRANAAEQDGIESLRFVVYCFILCSYALPFSYYILKES